MSFTAPRGPETELRSTGYIEAENGIVDAGDAMKQTPKTGKRIVSKAEYVKRQGKRVSQGLAGTGLYVSAVACGLLAVFLLVVFWQAVTLYTQPMRPEEVTGVLSLGSMIVVTILSALCGGIWFCRKSALQILKQAHEMDTGVPLTRANSANLSAGESLVRASKQPVMPQRDVLLRPATETQDTHTEQLLRPS